MSNSLWPHESQYARSPCPSPTPRVHSDSRPSSQWCHPAISSCIVPFSSCSQSLPASESFPMSQLFAWGGQSTGVSASAPVFPMNTQDWYPLGWTGWTSLQPKGLSRVFSNTKFKSINYSTLSFLYGSTLTWLNRYYHFYHHWAFRQLPALFQAHVVFSLGLLANFNGKCLEYLWVFLKSFFSTEKILL